VPGAVPRKRHNSPSFRLTSVAAATDGTSIFFSAEVKKANEEKRMIQEHELQSAPLAPEQRRLRYPAMIELIILGGIVFVLMIALLMVRSLVNERATRSKLAREEIATSWGKSQTIGGPVLIIPYRVRYNDAAGRPQISNQRARFLPARVKTSARVQPERRHRGIFESILYRADLRIEGTFARPDFSSWNVAAEDVLWNEAVITVGIPDLRGVRGNPVLQWGAQRSPFTGGSEETSLWATGLSAAVPMVQDASVQPAAYPFAFDLGLNGSEQLGFYPIGGETIVELEAPWPDPSFTGAYLPESRAITEKGFKARWSISSVARSFPQQWKGPGDEVINAMAPTAFGVSFFSPVGLYQKTERSMKYGVLFIVLTFLTFFLYELLSPVTLHPVQYFLVGGALCLFYLLLLSIAEHAGFGVAYAVASSATVGLICSYGSALLRNRLRVLGLAGVLTLLYGYLYVLLQLEDWALLLGSVGLFAILALVMYTTRRVDWGSAHVGRVREAEA
jgi:inner membrane protein